MNNKEFQRKKGDIRYHFDKDTEFAKEFTKKDLHQQLDNEMKQPIKKDFGDYSTKELYEIGEEFYKNQNKSNKKN